MANHYYKDGNYTLAIKEYQRTLFFSQNTDPKILYQVGMCFQKLDQYDKASEFFDKAFFSFTTDSLKLNALFKKAECLLLNKDYSLALTELFGISDTVSANNYHKRELYSGIAYFGIEDFDNAEKCFINAVDSGCIAEREHIKTIFKDKKRFYRPKPTTASILSMCFPGLGQFYSGDIRNGLNSVVLTSALVFLGVRIAVNQTIWDALFTIAPWYQRYYQGGYIRAENIALEKRANKRRLAYEEIIQIIADTRN
jgi:tetratricopeptide (TPR) repeat protein